MSEEPGVINLPTVGDVRAAADRIEGVAYRTPLIGNADINQTLGGRVLLKLETMQRTGSFKFRGAYNRLSKFSAQERGRGVVTFSSGNHAQGVSAAAKLLGIRAVIVMPADAPAIKIERTRRNGAEIVFYDRQRQDRLAIATDVADETGGVLIPPYDDGDIIAGQGTAGLEIVAQARAPGTSLDAVIICCGGGGLTAGCALAVSADLPGCDIYTAEPAGFDDTRRSLEAGRRLSVDRAESSICDALLTPSPGELTFAINRRLVTGGLTVTDEEVRRAMATAFREFKIVVEPGGAAALAAVLEKRLDPRDRAVAVVVTGGNVDPSIFAEAIGIT